MRHKGWTLWWQKERGSDCFILFQGSIRAYLPWRVARTKTANSSDTLRVLSLPSKCKRPIAGWRGWGNVEVWKQIIMREWNSIYVLAKDYFSSHSHIYQTFFSHDRHNNLPNLAIFFFSKPPISVPSSIFNLHATLHLIRWGFVRSFSTQWCLYKWEWNIYLHFNTSNYVVLTRNLNNSLWKNGLGRQPV